MRAMVVAGAILVAAIAVILVLTLDLELPDRAGKRTAADAAFPVSPGPGPDIKAPPPELPSLLGRPGEDWVDDLLGEEEVATSTVDKLAEAGVDAVPLLAALILHTDPHVRWAATRVLERLSELGGHTAVRTLLILAEKAGDPDVRERSVQALGKMSVLGREMIVPVLIKASKDRHDAVRIAVAEALGLLGGPEASEALRIIRREDVELLVRITATDSLLYLVMQSIETGEGIPDRCRIGIEVFTSGESPRQRAEAATVLGHQGPEAAEAIPILVAACRKDGNGAAIWALARLGPGGVRALTDLLRGDLARATKISIIRALGDVGPDARAAAPVLIGLLKDRDLAWLVADVLGKIGGADATTRLLGLFEQESWSRDLYFVSRTLAVIGDERCVAVFAEDLRTTDDMYRRSVLISALGQMGGKARSTVPILLDVLEKLEEGAPGNYELIHALGRIGGPEAAEAVRARFHGSSDQWHQMSCLGALGNMGADAGPAVPEIAALLDRGDRTFRWAAIACLRQLGPVAKSAVPSLERLLDHPEAYIRRAASYALKAIKGN